MCDRCRSAFKGLDRLPMIHMKLPMIDMNQDRHKTIGPWLDLGPEYPVDQRFVVLAPGPHKNYGIWNDETDDLS